VEASTSHGDQSITRWNSNITKLNKQENVLQNDLLDQIEVVDERQNEDKDSFDDARDLHADNTEKDLHDVQSRDKN